MKSILITGKPRAVCGELHIPPVLHFPSFIKKHQIELVTKSFVYKLLTDVLLPAKSIKNVSFPVNKKSQKSFRLENKADFIS
jgi:hypothetical protein